MAAPTARLRYVGPSPFVYALAQLLEEQGVEVEYERPGITEQRDAGTALADVSVILGVTGNAGNVAAGVRAFRARFARAGHHGRGAAGRAGPTDEAGEL